MNLKTIVKSSGSYVPDNIIHNRDLKLPPSLIPLVEQKTGVKSRRFAGSAQCTSDLAIIAAEKCLGKAQFDPLLIDGIILATSSPDRIQPATATRLQHKIGAAQAFAFDVNSVCSGGIYALCVADALLRAGFCKNLLVVAAEIYSKFLDPQDFSTYPYFGDGAGAVLLSAESGNVRGIIHTILKTDGSGADVIQVPGGGTMLPYNKIQNKKDVYFKMVGREVFNFAINRGTEIIKEMFKKTAISPEQINYFILHQANINIINEISARIGIAPDRFIVNLDKYGNTAAASVLISLDELIESGNVKSGDLIMLVAFGGGLSWAATLIEI